MALAAGSLGAPSTHAEIAAGTPLLDVQQQRRQHAAGSGVRAGRRGAGRPGDTAGTGAQ